MKVTFLGTGTSQGVPVIACTCPVCSSSDFRDQRLRCSILVEYPSGLNLVVDTGPDFRQQMLRAGVKYVDAVLYTHEHKDHIAGMDDIRAFNYVLQKHMDLYLNERVEKALRREFSYVFAEEKYPGIPLINLHRIDTTPFVIQNELIEPVEVMHFKLPVLGFKFGGFCYITDANYIAEEEKKKLFGLDVLVINALRREKHVSHFTLAQALDLVAELRPKRALLTHISHQLGKHAEVSLELPEGVELAYDGLVIDL